MPEEQGPTVGCVHVKITCPDRSVADQDAVSVLIPAEEGNRLIIPRKAPLICLIRQGYLVINCSDGKSETYCVSDGICEVRRDICSVMAWAVRRDEIDRARVAEQLKETQIAMQTLGTSVKRQELADRANFYRFLLKTP